MKRLSPTAHAALDYALGATLLIAPAPLRLTPKARLFFKVFGATATVVNGLTRTPLGVRKLIPWRTHRAIDLATDPLYLGLPLVLGIAREPRARGLWLASSALLHASVALTDWDAPPEG